MLKASNGIMEAYLSWIVRDQTGTLVAAEFFDRSAVRVRSLCASIVSEDKTRCRCLTVTGMEGGSGMATVLTGGGYDASYSEFKFGRDRCNVGTVTNRELGRTLILSARDDFEEDFYAVLMREYNLPILREWAPYLLGVLKSKGLLKVGKSYLEAAEGAKEIFLHGKPLSLSEVRLARLCLTEDDLREVISEGLLDGRITVCKSPQRPLYFGPSGNSLDAYVSAYGKELQKNVEKAMEPLSPLLSHAEGFVTKKIRPYPQQAAVIGGMLALVRKGERFGIVNCEMGTGKTIMGIGVVEAWANQNWLAAHPGKTLKEMYLGDPAEKPKYRVAVMPPGHLVEKWKREILREVPDAVVEVVTTLRQLTELRGRGRTPKGREWYVIGKDFCKLDGTESPIPVNLSSGPLVADYCEECYEETGMKEMKVMRGKYAGRCPRCGERKFSGDAFPEYGTVRGLTCPSCNRILINPARLDGTEDGVNPGLMPEDFAGKKESNAFCAHCGAPLWGITCRPVGGEPRRPAWRKVSHFSNWTLKSRKTAWVLRGSEQRYYDAARLINPETGKPYPEMDLRATPQEFSPRKYAPSRYVKKYLKGYFDFLILDEVHKYAGLGTGQSNAAHALVKASRFTLGLTGTLTNGKADSLFSLLFMLMPQKMKKEGFSYGDPLAFARKYGCIEATYEAAVSGDGTYRNMTRGRLLKPPRSKPGISPLVYGDFLLEHAVSMSIADMTRYMPPLVEKVEVLRLPEEVQRSYDSCASKLKEASDKKGSGALGETLSFCLSYPDKPYGRERVMDPGVKDRVILVPPSHEKYRLLDELLPKERRIVEIIKREQEEGRNVFVFANFTGKEESNVTGRLKAVIERHCNMTGRVEVLRADSPEALKREAYIHERARMGVRCVITNAKVCETGLDFCWEEGGVFYNYPTIIFAQPTYELATMMQASRRHYRLNQVTECRTYWMAYENTLQSAALQIMASKQVAAAAIQGKFSADGLAAMAQGVDARILLAKKFADDDNSSAEELAGMFDVLARSAQGEEGEDDGYVPPLLYHEVMGTDYAEEPEAGRSLTLFDLSVEGLLSARGGRPEETKVIPFGEGNEVDAFAAFASALGLGEDVRDETVIPFEGAAFRRRTRQLRKVAGQTSLF